MGQYLRINGDYNIKCADGAKIVLDTGPSTGEVVVTGALRVEGDFLTVNVENLDVQDNIIVLNFGETGAGVTLGYSGIEVERGSLSNASFIFDESIDSFVIAQGSAPSLSFSDSNLKLRRIYTDGSTDNGDLTLIGTGIGVVKVSGTVNYENQVTDDDDIPNKKYVDDAIQNNPTFQIVTDNSRVTVTDVDTAGSAAYIAGLGYPTGGESAVSVIVDTNLVARFFPNRTVIGQIEISGTEIATEDSITNENIVLKTQGTGKIQINYGLQMEQIAVTPAYVANSTIVYAADPDIGESGVFFVNDNPDVHNRTGELISKNKALVFSMLF